MTSLTIRIVLATALTCGLVARAGAADPASSFDPEVARRMNIQDVQKHRTAGDKIIIVDARAQETDVIVPGAVHVPNDEIDTWAKGTPKDALIVTYCT
jgi:hypothetical protein